MGPLAVKAQSRTPRWHQTKRHLEPPDATIRCNNSRFRGRAHGPRRCFCARPQYNVLLLLPTLWRTPLRRRSIFDIILVCVIWGSGFAAMKVGLRHVPSFMFVGLRFILTALVLTAFMQMRAIPFSVAAKHAGTMTVIVLLFFTQQGLIFWGLNYTLASRTAVILNTQPIWTAVLAHFFVSGDRLTRLKAVGLCLAFAGVLALFHGQVAADGRDTMTGDLMMLGAALAWAVQNVVTKGITRHVEPMTIVFWQALCSAMMFFVVSGFVERGLPMSFGHPTFLFCLIYIVLVATAYSFVKWVDLIRHNDPSTVASFCFVTPVAGVLFGRVLLTEPITWDIVLATGAVAGGIVCANLRRR